MKRNKRCCQFKLVICSGQVEDFGILQQVFPADFPLPAKFEQRQVKGDMRVRESVQYNNSTIKLVHWFPRRLE